MLMLLGFLMIVLVIPSAWMFHAGWRRRHPEEGWPLGAILSFGAPVVAGAGLVVGSWVTVLTGVLLWAMARLAFPKPVI